MMRVLLLSFLCLGCHAMPKHGFSLQFIKKLNRDYAAWKIIQKQKEQQDRNLPHKDASVCQAEMLNNGKIDKK